MLLLTSTREWAKRASAPETQIFMPQKCDISVWPIATPSAIIVNTIIKVHFIYQISEVLPICKWLSAKETTCTIFQWGISLFNHWWFLREPRIIPPWDLHVPFTRIIGSPAILFLAIMLHNVCFILHLSLHKWCQEKNTCTGKIHLCASDFWSF